MALDLGTTSLGAVLFNQLTGQSYPLQWQATGQTTSPTVHWRLPAVVQVIPHDLYENSPENLPGSPPTVPGSVRVSETGQQQDAATAEVLTPTIAPTLSDNVELQLPHPQQPAADGLLLCNLKAALDIGLPYYSEAQSVPEPRLNWFFRAPQKSRKLKQTPTVPLRVILRSLQQLCAAIKPNAETVTRGDLESDRPAEAVWQCQAQDLTPTQLAQILSGLEGIVVNSPTRCTEAYRFNLREVILAAQLVQRPEQIAFLENPIAALLAEFHSQRSLNSVFSNSQPPPRHWQGATLVIHVSTSATELGLACLPKGLHNLSRDDLHLRSLAYGNQAYLQDIACQLLYPFIPEDQIDLDLAVLPLPGEADSAVRSRLQRQLYRSATGRMLLEAAGHLNRALRKQDRMVFELGPHRSSFSQTTLDTKVTQPYILKLTREINHLLEEAELEINNIAQVLCTGSGATLDAIQAWLKTRLPQAQVITDTINSDPHQDLLQEATSPSRPDYASHRITYGLATLPLYPQLLNRQRQQYSDYFLLVELLRCLPDEALTLEEILNHLEGRGINTQSCWQTVEAILAGQQPAGLVPQASDDVWILESRQNPDYQALEAPLFRAIAEGAYQVDPVQRQRFWQYWQQVTAHSHQTLEEPYILQVGLSLADSWA